jgi:hypothetical protein
MSKNILIWVLAVVVILLGIFVWTSIIKPQSYIQTPENSPSPETTLSPQSSGEITILYPNGGEALQAGKTYSIRWSATGSVGGAAILELVTPTDTMSGGWFVKSVLQIGTVSLSDGSIDWTVPNSITAGSNYKIRIITPDDSGDVSDATFAITK